MKQATPAELVFDILLLPILLVVILIFFGFETSSFIFIGVLLLLYPFIMLVKPPFTGTSIISLYFDLFHGEFRKPDYKFMVPLSILLLVDLTGIILVLLGAILN
jgi:hypothetical protein